MNVIRKKVFYGEGVCDELIAIGEAEEIKRIEKKMRKAWINDRSNIWPSHLGGWPEYQDGPIFKAGEMYGISVETRPESNHSVYYIVNASNCLHYFA